MREGYIMNDSLENQIKKVINILEKDYKLQITNGGYIEEIYNNYKQAFQIIKSKKNLEEIKILGYTKGYTMNFSDYNTPLLREMWEAEKQLSEFKRKNFK